MREGLHLSQTQSLQQRLAPQQVQFLKLLQLPLLALEQSIKAELEQNPMLEDVDDIELSTEAETPLIQEQLVAKERETDGATDTATDAAPSSDAATDAPDAPAADPLEYEEFSTYANDETGGFKTYESQYPDREDNPAPSVVTLAESLSAQLPLLNLTPVEMVIAEEIVGNIDPDGYLRRPLADIVDDLNASIHPAPPVVELAGHGNHESSDGMDMMDGIADDSLAITAEPATDMVLEDLALHSNGDSAAPVSENAPASPIFDVATAERVLHKVQLLDPVGIAARDLQECLIVQLMALPQRSHAQELALRILRETFAEFMRKHYEVMLRRLGTTEDALRAAFDEIQKLNPKPGNTTYGTAEHTVIPDFTLERLDDELVITLNDNSVPQIRISRQYKGMLDQGRTTKLPREARTFLRQKYDAAKSFVTALQQRRITMLKTMRAIAELQREFFFEGEQALKPLFYRHIADRIGVDVSTVCRVVNGKYVQCDAGVYELRYFFSDSITTDEGDEVSNRVMKTRIKDVIANEDKKNPLSDDDIARMLHAEGFNIARRTVAKYRESQHIPIARLRRELL